jgi:sensor histidine kinase YesM
MAEKAEHPGPQPRAPKPEHTPKKHFHTAITGSISSVTLKIFIPLFLVIAVGIGILSNSMMQSRQLAYKYIEDTAELYIDQFNHSIRQINADVVLLMSNNADIAQLPYLMEPSDARYYATVDSIREQNRTMKLLFTDANNFYVYKRSAELLILEDGSYFKTSAKTPMISAVTDFLNAQQELNDTAVNWTFLSDGTQDYMLSWFYQNGIAMGCVIRMSDIFSKLQNMNMSYEVLPYVRMADGTLIKAPQETDGTLEALAAEAEREEKLGRGTGKYQLCSYPLASLGSIKLLILPSGGALENAMRLQLVLLCLLGVLLTAALLTGYLYYRRILRPMKRFVSGLHDLEQNQMLSEDGSNHILELEQASNEFKELLGKIENLKIAVYEKELEQQRTELEYNQERIKPHFFLNCLSIIHGIAETDGEEKIVAISETLSNYFRYIFRDMRSLRSVAEEVAHVQDYITIQKMRYGEKAFSFEVICDGEVQNLLLPALMLQTLVENAVSHGVSLDTRVDITLYLVVEHYEDGSYLYLSLSDTGVGFPPEVLSALAAGQPIEYGGRRHIGLSNVQKRLRLLYGGRASIEFSNMGEKDGAVVEVRLPAQSQSGAAEPEKNP